MFDENEKYYVWGAGTYTKRLIDYMGSEPFLAIIDRAAEKQGTVYCGLPVISYEQSVKQGNAKIVISLVYPNTVRDFLLREGLVEYKNFVTLYDFIPRWFKSRRNTLVPLVVNFTSAVACTLKCEHCQTFMPLLQKPRIIPVEEMIYDADLLFSHIDSVLLVNVCFGESFMNKNLSKFVKHLYDKYSDRYGSICLLTNGTIVPPDEELKTIAECGATLSISNYTDETMKITESLKRLVEKCKEYEVKYYMNTSSDKSSWFDFGDPRIVQLFNEEEKRDRYKQCFKAGCGVLNRKLYLCNTQNCAETVTGCAEPDDGDYFDLQQEKTPESDIELYKIISRNPDKGYVSHCERCNGSRSIYQNA